ncbi:MAG: TIGR03088 family PEP-CTERM/XrtA system glycosyltransferase [Hydrogenophaga sp.]|uniref:TIGR03088 family PEP-CTERM/XrtA system glycosyltransferase n=1 Tax=Hydrogenophaga sp. TaxID=1904254 RepID=UPI001DD4BE2D|nr:TIGR03088 family PEP-CTERM/XrtA system glycosyltransferase [Hydrogenophaga sp.]MBX3610156.1 TIGR03088 family PEP-CTERM/XrtA system glycosyltransferase [Hydrogenophaga sp.]
MTRRRRVVHVVYRFDVGGLENVIVQLINRLPPEQYEHVVLSMTTVGDFSKRVERPDVQFIALDKPAGHAVGLYPRIWRLLRALRPDVLHTCNLAPLEIVPVAWLAGVPLRIHVEHGWDAHDPNGKIAKYRWLRRAYRPFVSRYVSVSADLDRYLRDGVGVPASRRRLIGNGVDTRAFRPGGKSTPAGCPFEPGRHWIVGTVGRMMTVKNQPLLAQAFVQLLRTHPELAERARLVMVGEGELRSAVERILDEAGMRQLAWLAGARSDVAEQLRSFDVFVLPSQAEGTSCTLQEAMASGLAVVATAVGGTPDLVSDGVDGLLVPSDDVAALTDALARLYRDDSVAAQLGAAARQRAMADFSIDTMVSAYDELFADGEQFKPVMN